jgi:ketosteroid isomerase-like protein
MNPRIVAGIVALALVVPLPAFAQAASGNLRSQAEKMARAWEKAHNAGDAAALTALYTSDAKLAPPGAEPAVGSKAIQKFFAKDLAQGVKVALTTSETMEFGDHGFDTGTWVATSSDGKHLDHGSYMTLYKKEGGGWKMYRGTWNSSMAQK